MDSMEINKLVGAAVGALLLYLGANFFSELYYVGPDGGHGGEAHYAYAIETDQAPAGETDQEPVDFQALMAEADVGRGERVYGKCRACHKLEDGANSTGPHLFDVVGREIAAVDGFSYSGALAEKEGAWTHQELSDFLEDPRSYAPGTKMTFAGLDDPEDRANVIAYIESTSN